MHYFAAQKIKNYKELTLNSKCGAQHKFTGCYMQNTVIQLSVPTVLNIFLCHTVFL